MANQCNIENNLIDINNNIKNASSALCVDVTLVGVTKTVPFEDVNFAIDNGLKVIGENKVQEFLEKYDYYKKDDLIIHFIGHLQSNKVKYIIDKVDVIESIDSIKLLDVVNKAAEKISKTIDVFIEINSGDEQSKTGTDYENAIEILDYVSQLNNVKITGFMTIPPFDVDPEQSRKYFKQMKRFFDEQKAINRKNVSLKYLSMGMSNDYVQAIEEGANIVRVGSSLFGKRTY